MQTNVFIGRVAASPTLSGEGDKKHARVTLIDNLYLGKDEQGKAKEKAISLQFTAFRNTAESLAKANKGDQLAVTHRIENTQYQKDGEDVYGYQFIVESFEFCAPGPISREAFNS